MKWVTALFLCSVLCSSHVLISSVMILSLSLSRCVWREGERERVHEDELASAGCLWEWLLNIWSYLILTQTSGSFRSVLSTNWKWLFRVSEWGHSRHLSLETCAVEMPGIKPGIFCLPTCSLLRWVLVFTISFCRHIINLQYLHLVLIKPPLVSPHVAHHCLQPQVSFESDGTERELDVFSILVALQAKRLTT